MTDYSQYSKEELISLLKTKKQKKLAEKISKNVIQDALETSRKESNASHRITDNIQHKDQVLDIALRPGGVLTTQSANIKCGYIASRGQKEQCNETVTTPYGFCKKHSQTIQAKKAKEIYEITKLAKEIKKEESSITIINPEFESPNIKSNIIEKGTGLPSPFGRRSRSDASDNIKPLTLQSEVECAKRTITKEIKKDTLREVHRQGGASPFGRSSRSDASALQCIIPNHEIKNSPQNKQTIPIKKNSKNTKKEPLQKINNSSPFGRRSQNNTSNYANDSTSSTSQDQLEDTSSDSSPRHGVVLTTQNEHLPSVDSRGSEGSAASGREAMRQPKEENAKILQNPPKIKKKNQITRVLLW
jgi:hypothetical protein